jgi:hypothetical protein
MFVSKETKAQAQALADKVKEMSLAEDAHPREAQWLYALGEMLEQLN